MIILGLNSGTSKDGISAVLFESIRLFPRAKINLLAHKEFPYPKAVLKELKEIEDKVELENLARLNFLLGEVFAEKAIELMKSSQIDPQKVDLIASHGQTIAHFPKPKKIGKYKIRASIQLAEPAVIAHRTGVTTVGDFRPGDLASGGEGAPVLAFSEYLLFASSQKTRLSLNLGGIANFTFIPKGAGFEQCRAMDACACNVFLDRLFCFLTGSKSRYDRDGKTALKGRAKREWVEIFLKHLEKKAGAQSLCATVFDQRWLKALLKKLNHQLPKDVPDILRSAVKAVAEMIYLTYSANFKINPDEIIVSGGGAKNLALIKELGEVFGAKILLCSELGIPLQAKEPIGFGILAELCLKGIQVNLCHITGAHSPAVLGKIIPGKNWQRLVKKLNKGVKR